MTMDEFELAESYGYVYKKLSIYDRIALAIAKNRKIILLTGDAPLRKVAMHEGVTVIGTIGILDKLYAGKYIDDSEYKYCLSELQRNNGFEIRLPRDELEKRLQQLTLSYIE